MLELHSGVVLTAEAERRERQAEIAMLESLHRLGSVSRPRAGATQGIQASSRRQGSRDRTG
jgi:hypothetical protein